MCMHCSQICSNCKPAEVAPIKCPQCGSMNLVSRADCLFALGFWKEANGPGTIVSTFDKGGDRIRNTCRNCESDLSSAIKEKIKPVECLYSNIICGYPCQRHKRPMQPNSTPCRKQVFAGKLSK